MKAKLLFLSILCSAAALAVDMETYYASLHGKSGKELFDAVHAVANKGFHQLSYADLWTAYGSTDLYPSDTTATLAGKIWDMYGEFAFTYRTGQCGGYKNPGDCYNREHSIPKSWFCECTTGMGADLFHIVPTDGKINGNRGNMAFGEVNGGDDGYGNKIGSAQRITITNTILGATYTTSSTPSQAFEPKDVYKGDFARGYLGTMVKWTTAYRMNEDDGAWFFNNDYTVSGHFGLETYGLALLMKWHREDPVSRKETNRNDGIQATQGNRNPFIDLPELAEYIWGEHAGEVFHILDETAIPQNTQHQASKVLKDGQIIIIQNNQSYDIYGRRR